VDLAADGVDMVHGTAQLIGVWHEATDWSCLYFLGEQFRHPDDSDNKD